MTEPDGQRTVVTAAVGDGAGCSGLIEGRTAGVLVPAGEGTPRGVTGPLAVGLGVTEGDAGAAEGVADGVGGGVVGVATGEPDGVGLVVATGVCVPVGVDGAGVGD